jgi:hypothetical protein
MAPTPGKLTIIITSEEAKALKKAISEYTTDTGSTDAKALKSVLEKLKQAEEKML